MKKTELKRMKYSLLTLAISHLSFVKKTDEVEALETYKPEYRPVKVNYMEEEVEIIRQDLYDIIYLTEGKKELEKVKEIVESGDIYEL